MALNIGQFMTQEVLDVDDSLWFAAYSHALQRVTRSMVVMAKGESAGGRSLSTGQGILGRNRH